MGIDRIGKGGGVAPAPETGAVKSTGAGFAVDAVEPGARKEGVEAATSVDAASPLARLRAGEIDVNGYVDLKVDEATRALPEGLSASDLADIKQILREQMASDPALTDLVRTATGGTATPPEDLGESAEGASAGWLGRQPQD